MRKKANTRKNSNLFFAKMVSLSFINGLKTFYVIKIIQIQRFRRFLPSFALSYMDKSTLPNVIK